jgi:hypothetical protein
VYSNKQKQIPRLCYGMTNKYGQHKFANRSNPLKTSQARHCAAHERPARRHSSTWVRPRPRATVWCWLSARLMKNPTESRRFPSCWRRWNWPERW